MITELHCMLGADDIFPWKFLFLCGCGFFGGEGEEGRGGG